jgi:hypothetical protein
MDVASSSSAARDAGLHSHTIGTDTKEEGAFP